MNRFQRLHLEGFKSIREMDLELEPLTVLIGANGAGKSNLVSFFRMLNFAMSQSLQEWIGREGGAASLLYYGSTTTPEIEADLEFRTDDGLTDYYMCLVHAAPDTLIFAAEALAFTRDGSRDRTPLRSLGARHKESALNEAIDDGDTAAEVAKSFISNCRCYQFHDTSPTADIRKQHYIEDNAYLKHDAGNLCSVLYAMKQTRPGHYDRIVGTIRQIAPFFDDFVLEPLRFNPENVMLNWRERGCPLVLFGPHELSDGSLSMMALVTLLLLPDDMLPSLIVIDEPELGLHPYAITVVASLMKSVSAKTPVIISTQSVGIVDNFEPQDIVVVNRREGASTFERLDPATLKNWLEDYSLSELWEKNVIGGRPSIW